MSTLNIVLMEILTVMIGFAIGNAYGQQKMKMILNELLKKMTDGLTNLASAEKKGESADR